MYRPDYISTHGLRIPEIEPLTLGADGRRFILKIYIIAAILCGLSAVQWVLLWSMCDTLESLQTNQFITLWTLICGSFVLLFFMYFSAEIRSVAPVLEVLFAIATAELVSISMITTVFVNHMAAVSLSFGIAVFMTTAGLAFGSVIQTNLRGDFHWLGLLTLASFFFGTLGFQILNVVESVNIGICFGFIVMGFLFYILMCQSQALLWNQLKETDKEEVYLLAVLTFTQFLMMWTSVMFIMCRYDGHFGSKLKL